MKYIRRNRNRNINIEDLLERKPIYFDNDLIEQDIRGKVILVTGGGGSIGSQLCRQVMEFGPKRLIILDIYENNAYNLLNELAERYPNGVIDVIIASVRDTERMERVFARYRPDIVFHTAAHKHVPLMELSPCEAVKNNVFGTYNTAICADKYGAERFVLISTDKAVKPISVMGATKRVCEMIVEAMQKQSKTNFTAVRFGNVLGSAGSVVPRFKAQIEAGGPVTVTHRETTRFFMTIEEAVQLVLQAAAMTAGGEIFVLDMGEPVRIYDLARKMIRLCGYRPDKDIKIEFTGLRAGDKLFEELIEDGQELEKTCCDKIFVLPGRDATEMEVLQQKLEKLKEALTDDEQIKMALKEIVPEYYIKRKEDCEMKTTLVIMAAGIGSRYGGGIKQLEKIGPNGEIIMDYSIYDALKAGFNKIVFIIRKDIEADFREIIGNRIEKLCDVEYVFQERDDLPEGFVCPADRTKPWGTGQAVLACRGVVNEPFAVINADDYYGKEAFVKIYDFLSRSGAEGGGAGKMSMVAFKLKNTLSDNGGVTRGVCSISADDKLVGVNETKNIIKKDGGAAVEDSDGSYIKLEDDTLVSMNFWGFMPEFIDYLAEDFKSFLASVPDGDIKSEYLIPIIVDDMLKKGLAEVEVLKSSDKWFGVTYKEDKETVVKEITALIEKGCYPSL